MRFDLQRGRAGPEADPKEPEFRWAWIAFGAVIFLLSFLGVLIDLVIEDSGALSGHGAHTIASVSSVTGFMGMMIIWILGVRYPRKRSDHETVEFLNPLQVIIRPAHDLMDRKIRWAWVARAIAAVAVGIALMSRPLEDFGVLPRHIESQVLVACFAVFFIAIAIDTFSQIWYARRRSREKNIPYGMGRRLSEVFRLGFLAFMGSAVLVFLGIVSENNAKMLGLVAFAVMIVAWIGMFTRFFDTPLAGLGVLMGLGGGLFAFLGIARDAAWLVSTMGVAVFMLALVIHYLRHRRGK